MKSFLKRIVISPIFWTTSIVIYFSLISFYKDNEFKDVIKSDGDGYYAYLPAILIYNDPTYQKSVAAEKKNKGKDFNQIYLFHNQDGKTYNKYFPGVAILQLPFFGIACFQSWITDQPIDGYSSIFQFWTMVGGWFYTVLGLYFFFGFIKQLIPINSRVELLLLWLILPTTPLLHYFAYRISFSHLYSFALFSALAIVLLKLKKNQKLIHLSYAGIILGLITLLRPTNILVVLILPFFFNSLREVLVFIQSILLNPKKIISLIGSYLLILVIFFSIIKWQTGSWFVWNYNGEGFDFLHPKIWESLFSFRTGLFTHTPVLFIAVIGWYFLLKENKFKAIALLVYFAINAWVISSWWCWDYENSFGNRPYMEHLVFLLPLVFIAVKHLRTVSLVFFFIFLAVSSIRYYDYFSGRMIYQRFTVESYVESLAFWNQKNEGRWQYTRSCKPFGKVKQEFQLLNQQEEITIEPNQEFALTAHLDLPLKRTTERLYFQVELDKKIDADLDFKDVLLVVDAIDKDGNYRYYNATELFNDRVEGKKNWKHLIFENQVYDNFQQLDELKLYLWNKGKQKIYLKNIVFRFYIYKG